jgi:hypothetical protein
MSSLVIDQKTLNASVACAILTAFIIDRKLRDKSFDFQPSVLFLYHNTLRRMKERGRNANSNTAIEDTGCRFEDALATFYEFGVPSEDTWPYDPSYLNTKPSRKAYRDAKYINAIEYKRVRQDLDTIRNTLRKGYAIMFGFSVFESFGDEMKWNPKLDLMPLPKGSETRVGLMGGLIVGYSNNRNACLVQTSWGAGFGNRGHFFIPFEYLLTPLCQDFYILRSAGNDEIIVQSHQPQAQVQAPTSTDLPDDIPEEEAAAATDERKKRKRRRHRTKSKKKNGVRFQAQDQQQQEQEDLEPIQPNEPPSQEDHQLPSEQKKKIRYNLVDSSDSDVNQSDHEKNK